MADEIDAVIILVFSALRELSELRRRYDTLVREVRVYPHDACARERNYKRELKALLTAGLLQPGPRATLHGR